MDARTGSRAAGDGEIRGLGPEPRGVTLVLDSGATVELAAHADAADTMVGPFVGLLVATADEPSPPA